MAASVRKAWRVTEGVRGNEAEISQGTLIYKFPHLLHGITIWMGILITNVVLTVANRWRHP